MAARFDHTLIQGADFDWLGKLGSGLSKGATDYNRTRVLKQAGGDYSKASLALKEMGDLEGSQLYQQLGDQDASRQRSFNARMGVEDLMKRIQAGKTPAQEENRGYVPGAPLRGTGDLDGPLAPGYVPGTMPPGLSGPRTLEETDRLSSPIISREPTRSPGQQYIAQEARPREEFSEAEASRMMLEDPRITAGMSPAELMQLMLKNRELAAEEAKAGATKGASADERKNQQFIAGYNALMTKHGKTMEELFKQDPSRAGTEVRRLIASDPDLVPYQSALLGWADDAFKREIPTAADIEMARINHENRKFTVDNFKEKVKIVAEGKEGFTGLRPALEKASNIMDRLESSKDLFQVAQSVKDMIKIVDPTMITDKELSQFLGSLGPTVAEQAEEFVKRYTKGEVPSNYVDKLKNELKIQMKNKIGSYENLMNNRPQGLDMVDDLAEPISAWRRRVGEGSRYKIVEE